MSNMDQSVLYYQAQEPGVIDEQSGGPGPFDQLIHAETIPPEQFKEPPYRFDNAEAFGVNQRVAKNWRGHTIEVGTDPIEIVPFHKGRKGLLLYVPPTATAAIYVDSSDATLGATGGPLGFYVPIGGALSIPAEDGCWAVSAGAATLVSFLDTWG